MMSPSDPSMHDDLFRERLGREIEQWRRDGLVRPEQASALLARYGFGETETPHTLGQSRIISILAVLGAILVGVGVIILIGANWQAMPKWSRVTLLIIAMTAAYTGGWRLSHGTGKYPKLGMALLLLGSLIWGAGIFLVGQMYHGGGEPGLSGERQALLYWFAGVLPLAYLFPSALHLCLALLIGLVAIGTALADAQASVGLWTALAIALGIFCYSLGEFHRSSTRLHRLSLPFRWLGMAQLFIGAYVLSFRDLWEYEIFDTHRWRVERVDTTTVWQLLLVVCALAMVAALAMSRIRRDRARPWESAGLIFLAVAAAGVATIASKPTLLGISAHPSPGYGEMASWYFMGGMNLVLFAITIGTVALGWVRTDSGLANFGLLAFSVLVFTRYFDLLGTMLSSGFLFVGAGVLLLAGGWGLERSRRKLLLAINERREQ